MKVAIALICNEANHLLITQRPLHATHGGCWEFPGGKIELGESPEQAFARELNEELGIIAEVGELRIACTHSYSDVGIIILFYEVLFWKGEPKTKHHINLKWVTPAELPKMNIPDANRKNLDRIYKAFNLRTDV